MQPFISCTPVRPECDGNSVLSEMIQTKKATYYFGMKGALGVIADYRSAFKPRRHNLTNVLMSLGRQVCMHV